ncbi:hypothetical protein DA2_2258 [Desulfovibrio sp. A2]|nr:hypothetical protein DA2_2258 [Desulfovibrio sp. A2]
MTDDTVEFAGQKQLCGHGTASGGRSLPLPSGLPAHNGRFGGRGPGRETFCKRSPPRFILQTFFQPDPR